MNYRGTYLKSLFALAFLAAASAAFAQPAFPSKPIRLIVPFGPGGSPDIYNRMVAKVLEPLVGQPVIVENRAGGNGIVGTNHAAKSAPDGYTILYASSSGISFARAQVKSLPYDPVNDFAGITIFQEGYFMLVVRPEDKGLTLAQFFDRLRRDPAGSPIGGTSATAQISNILMSNAAKLSHTYVPYKDFAPMLNDLLGGRLAALFTPINSILPNIAQGQVSPLGIMSPGRLPVLAGTPAIAEAAPGASLATWLGYMVPAKTPRPVVDYLYEKMAIVMRDPAILKWNENAGRALLMNPSEMDAFVRKDTPRWPELFRAAGIEPQ